MRTRLYSSFTVLIWFLFIAIWTISFLLDNTEDPGKLGGFCNGSVPCIDDHAKCDDTSSNGVCKCDAINFFRNHEGICVPGR